MRELVNTFPLNGAPAPLWGHTPLRVPLFHRGSLVRCFARKNAIEFSNFLVASCGRPLPSSPLFPSFLPTSYSPSSPMHYQSSIAMTNARSSWLACRLCEPTLRAIVMLTLLACAAPLMAGACDCAVTPSDNCTTVVCYSVSVSWFALSSWFISFFLLPKQSIILPPGVVTLIGSMVRHPL